MTLAIVRQHGRELCRLIVRGGSKLVRVEWCEISGQDGNHRSLGRALACVTSAFGYCYMGEGSPVLANGLAVELVGGAWEDVPDYILPIVARREADA
mgnify:CR=1 FL=1